MPETKKLWILKSKGEESAFGGNTGYADNPVSHYVYDTTVKNHNKITTGDWIIITGKKFIIGYATITSIDLKSGIDKVRYRCPICHTQEHYSRKGKSPKYKCREKHEFDIPDEENIIVDEFVANYGSTFIAAKPQTSVTLLEPYYVKRNLYYSIQQANPQFLEKELSGLWPSSSKQNLDSKAKRLNIQRIPIYIPTHHDHRDRMPKDIAWRKGQNKFKSDLINIYGSICMITGCSIPITIEASHVCPYRGKNDNNPYNGLLLRADLHKLFDSDLIGINPETLTVEIHTSIENDYYESLNGKKLKISRTDFSPSTEALEYRWQIFKQN